MNAFGKYLENLRGKMSLREASQRIGISHTYIRDLELGKKNDPSRETLRKIAEGYGHSYNDLLEKVGYITNDNRIWEARKEELISHNSKFLDSILSDLTVDGKFYPEVQKILDHYKNTTTIPDDFLIEPDNLRKAFSSDDFYENGDYLNWGQNLFSILISSYGEKHLTGTFNSEQKNAAKNYYKNNIPTYIYLNKKNEGNYIFFKDDEEIDDVTQQKIRDFIKILLRKED